MQNFEEFKTNSLDFNKISGQEKNFQLPDIENQFKLLLEEVEETRLALALKDKEGVLDGFIDCAVIVIGALQKLQNAGYNVDKGLLKISRNNLSKFAKDKETAIATVEYYKQQGVECKYEYNEVYDCYVIRDSNNKVRKPLGYVSVDLSDCVPKE